MSVGFGSSGLGAIGGAVTDIVMNTVGDALLSILGMDNFRTIFAQDESGEDGVRQYNDEPTDRGLWYGTVDKSRPDYYFILKGPQTMKLYGSSLFAIEGVNFRTSGFNRYLWSRWWSYS
jgi:hypothetical protein